MNNQIGAPLLTKKPYSAEAVKELLTIEKNHINNQGNGEWGWCEDCIPKGDELYNRFFDPGREEYDPPCETVAKAYESAARETKIAVALMLSGKGR